MFCMWLPRWWWPTVWHSNSWCQMSKCPTCQPCLTNLKLVLNACMESCSWWICQQTYRTESLRSRTMRKTGTRCTCNWQTNSQRNCISMSIRMNGSTQSKSNSQSNQQSVSSLTLQSLRCRHWTMLSSKLRLSRSWPPTSTAKVS